MYKEMRTGRHRGYQFHTLPSASPDRREAVRGMEREAGEVKWSDKLSRAIAIQGNV